MAASSGATDLQLYGSRKQMHRIPPSFQPRSDRWTLLYLVSPPLPPNISVLRFEIVSHDQGWCSRPQDGSWSWFEVSILGSWQENAKPDFSNLNDAIYLKSYPDDFGMMIQEQGLYFKEIPTKGNEGRMDPSSAISLQFAKNSIQPEWKHQAVVWTRRDSDTKGARFLSVLEEGDRLAIWVRVQFPGWENFVKEARISLSTTAEKSSERQYDTSPSMPTEIERRQVEGSISHDNLDDKSSVTRANKNPEESIRIARQNTNLDPQHIKESENLEEAIQVSRQAVAATPKDHPNFTGRLNNLGNKLQSRYKRTGEIADLEEAIQLSRQAIAATPKDHPDFVGWLNNLGAKLGRRYERTGRIDDLGEAIRIFRQAVQATPRNNPYLIWWLDNLGNALDHRYGRTGQIVDLEEAIQLSRQAVTATPRDHPNLTGCLNNLGAKLGRRYEQTGQIEDLEEAIQLSRQVVTATPKDHPDLIERLSNLGNKLQSRYNRTRQIGDLEEAIQIFRQVIQVTPKDYPDLAGWLNDLGSILGSRYERTGQIEDLEEAIQLSRQAVQVTPIDHPDLIVWLNNLGAKLGRRYEQKGQIDDLEEAIRIFRQAVQATPKDYPDLTRWLNNLGNILGHRYERTGQIADLEEAIQLSRQAVTATPEDHPNITAFLNNLGNKLESRYKRTGQIEDLEEAIQKVRQAVQITPKDHPNLILWLSNLGNKLQSRYKRTGLLDDLEEAIRIFRQVVQDTPKDHPDLAIRLNSFGNELHSRYERTGQIADLEETIQLSHQAVAITPEDHPSITAFLNNLGNKLESRYKRTGQMGDLEQAIRVSRQAFQSKLAPPLDRINAATLALRLLIEREDYHGGYALSVEAIDLLQLVHKRSLTLQDQQYVVSYFSGLATHACSLAIKTRQPLFEALRLLESGRAVILSLLMNDRSDTSKLKEAHPILCARYESLRLEVNAPKSTTSQQTGAFVSTRRPKATEELEECLQDIRNLPGFDSFQRGLTTKQMQNSSNQGSIIVVNVTGLQSDAIIVSPTGFSLVPLPRFSAVQAQSWVDQKLTLASPSERGMKNKSYRQFLAWLWRECVKPILTELGHSVQSSLENLPRVWWIGTGLASSFPFHAACDISAGENTLCRVLSSYTPSIQALLHARERVSISTPSNENPSTLLMVTMSNTPGADDLPGVKAERYTVLGALGSCVQVKTLDQPDAASVMHQIRECHIAHFACHGTSNSRDPSQSGLLLQTTTANPRQDILSVLKLCENHPTLGEIAYLSACSTAENQAEDLIDEVLHVVSGFQVAGFRHVIGTLWPSDDSVCVEVARSFYAELCRNGSLEYTDRTIAVALHKAVSAVSTSVDYGKRPLHWAQYVHYGA